MWTIPATMQVTSQAKLRIRSLQDSSLQGTSSGSFQIAPAGRDFYINDNSTVGDTFTVATGADDNHGKSPNQPMQTLAALLDNYDLDPGDVIHVDNGTYIALQSVKVRNDDSVLKSKGRPRVPLPSPVTTHWNGPGQPRQEMPLMKTMHLSF